MKRIILLLFILSPYSICFAQSDSESSSMVFAVGEAQLELDPLIFSWDDELIFKTNKEKALAEKVFKKMERNFEFYKHLFSLSNKYVELSKKPEGKNTLNGHIIGIVKKADKYQFVLISQKDWKTVSSATLNFSGKIDTIEYANDLSDLFYKKITGKDKSIFSSKIVFVSDLHTVKGKRRPKIIKELYVMDFDGERARRLTRNKSMVIGPSISFSKNLVVYSLINYRHRKRTISLFSYNLKKDKIRLISNRKGLNTGAVFLPGDKEIALTLSFKGQTNIYAHNLKTGKLRNITRNRGLDVDPSFSTRKDMMAFLSDRSGKAMVYTLDPRGIERDVKRISYVGKFNATPRMSPDGQEIAFSSWVDNGFDIYRISADGKNLARLTKDFGSNEDPSYSNDGEFILFSSKRVLSSTQAVQRLYIMNRNGEIIRSLAPELGNCTSPRWSK